MFAGYDKNKSGFLDEREFCDLATQLGFGAAAHDLFIELDKDQSGEINYDELLSRLYRFGVHEVLSGFSGGH